jgi:hypothetical protein
MGHGLKGDRTSTGHHRRWRQALLTVLFVPAWLWCAMSSGCAEKKTRKVTPEGPGKKYEVRTIA